MPHAALWVVQLLVPGPQIKGENGFNAARGFVGGAVCWKGFVTWNGCGFNAARGFVGGADRSASAQDSGPCSFNAARGFVGGAGDGRVHGVYDLRFQCRTRLCGWCRSSLAALVPLGGKSPFGKSPEI